MVKIDYLATSDGQGLRRELKEGDLEYTKVEISAELEMFTYDQKPRFWSHDHRPLNLWGEAWLRS